MSLELEALEQLVDSDMPLPVIRGLFPSDDHFLRALIAMLRDQQIRLFIADGDVPAWQWLAVLSDSETKARLSILPKGARILG